MLGWTAVLSPPGWLAFLGALLATMLFWLLAAGLYRRSWRQRRAAQRDELVRLRGEHTLLQQQSARLRAELEALREEHGRARATVAAQRAVGDTDRETIALFRAQIDALQTWCDQAQRALLETRSELAILKQERDPLVEIAGIGPVYQQRLYEAGVQTFAQLAARTGEELAAIVKAEEWQRLDFSAWIADARTLAAGGTVERRPAPPLRHRFRTRRDRLVRIKGIFPQVEQQLWAAGITTYAQLARCSENEIRAILGPAEGAVDVRGWIQEARRLVEQSRDQD